MTTAYRSLAAAHGPAHLPAPHGPLTARALKAIAVVCLATAAVCACVRLTIAMHAQASDTERTAADARAALVPGMSRADCYAWLRAHRLVATNAAFAVWRKSAAGVWYRADDGAWPRPGGMRTGAPHRDAPALRNPDVDVRMSSGSGAACGMTVAEHISFDRYDRIAHVAPSAAYWSCS